MIEICMVVIHNNMEHLAIKTEWEKIWESKQWVAWVWDINLIEKFKHQRIQQHCRDSLQTTPKIKTIKLKFKVSNLNPLNQ
jgi:hypothetical protein